MEQQAKLRNAGCLVFCLSGICAISCGVVVSHLQGVYGFAYGLSGTLLSMMNVGNLVASFLAGVLPGRIGLRRTALLLSAGYAIGYLMMGMGGWVPLLVAAFLLVGIAKGCLLNVCTIVVGDNSPDRPRGMNTMHACYALGALLCPFVLTLTVGLGNGVPMLALACVGVVIWLAVLRMPLAGGGKERTATDWSFLRNTRFWLLTALIFCQLSAENSVTGWLVTYFKDCSILSAAVSPYTVTLLWGATMVARLGLAFVFPPQNPYRAMVWMGLGCTVFYFGLMCAHTQAPALLLLLAFSLSIAGMNPTAVACAGRMTSVTSMGVMLPVASLGGIIMPWVIGQVADRAGMAAGMAANLVPCAGMLVFALLVRRSAAREQAAA